MPDLIDELDTQLRQRAFLYDDPTSYLAGARDAIEWLRILMRRWVDEREEGASTSPRAMAGP